MPGATVFVLCSVAYAWAGWRLARRLLGAHDGPHLPVLLLAACVLTAALLVVVTAGLGGFGAVPLRMPAAGPFATASIIVLGSVYVATRPGGPIRPVAGPFDRLSGGLAAVAGLTFVVVAVDLASRSATRRATGTR